MGKGTKHASDWKMTTLKVAIDARRLYCHSVKIMSNEKVFKLVKGNSARLLRRMDAFYKNLEMEIDNEERCRKAA